ncbi:MAG: hypothetical protein JXR52_08675 [Bacteroidales bacterium]|nr:hypothetical protein [Bacteroidales bacterium]MBN2698886.1 hypothetical protein [Bacteroidales bacterium]
MNILIVSQDYRDFDRKFGDIGQDTRLLKEIYTHFHDRKGTGFKKEFTIEYFFDTPKDFRELRTRIATGNYDLVHFSLHGYNGKIFFSDSEELSFQRFASLFSAKSNVKAVILNICESSVLAGQISKNIDRVIGWENKPTVAETQKLTEEFYFHLFGGSSLSESFKALEDLEDIQPVIYQPGETDKQDKPKKRKHPVIKWILPGIIIIAILLIIIITTLNRVGNEEKKIPPEERQTPKETVTGNIDDKLVINYPSANSTVAPNEVIAFTAHLRSGSKPWVFIQPPNAGVWYPQFRPETKDSINWQVRCTIGNPMDSGEFTIIVMAVDNSIAGDMLTWINSQGTETSSEPLSPEILETFCRYAADTIKVLRTPVNK